MRESIKKMAKITILNDDAVNHRLTADMIVTDPPFEMSGKQINDIISQYNSNHLLLICSLRQLIEFAQATSHPTRVRGLKPPKGIVFSALSVRTPHGCVD